MEGRGAQNHFRRKKKKKKKKKEEREGKKETTNKREKNLKWSKGDLAEMDFFLLKPGRTCY